MTYIIPDTKTADKDEIVKHIEEYLNSGNSLAYINDLLHEIAPQSHRHTAVARDIAHKMRGTGNYDFKEEPIIGSTEAKYFVYKLPPVVIPPKGWAERNVFWDKVRTGVITGGISLLVGWLLLRLDSQSKDQLNKQQDQHLIRLDSSINSFENRLADSVSTLRSDTTLKNK